MITFNGILVAIIVVFVLWILIEWLGDLLSIVGFLIISLVEYVQSRRGNKRD